MNYNIREMLESDISVCTNLIFETYKQENIWIDWSIDNINSDLKKSFNNPRYKEKYFVAVLNDEIIGIAGVGSSIMSTNSFELCYGTVKHEHQRKGIGTSLTIRRIEYVKTFIEHGHIFVSSRYPRFFHKLGFITIMDKYKINGDTDGAFCCLKY